MPGTAHILLDWYLALRTAASRAEISALALPVAEIIEPRLFVLKAMEKRGAVFHLSKCLDFGTTARTCEGNDSDHLVHILCISNVAGLFVEALHRCMRALQSARKMALSSAGMIFTTPLSGITASGS